MKILYAIQGTGNGHLSRARDIIPLLKAKGEVDVLVSGIQADVNLDYPVKYTYSGLSFIFGKSGGVNIWETFNKCDFRRLRREIKSVPVENYDLVINDFEPISAWACFLKGKTCVSLSHQTAVIAKGAPRPAKKDLLGYLILKYYAPATAAYGFHFHSFGTNIFTPVIRQQVRNMEVTKEPHYTVYLPSYSDKHLVKILSKIPDVQWDVFSKHNKKPFVSDNVRVRPVNNEDFISSMVSSTGVLCGAGFETPSEALFLEKKLMVIPMKGQFEQQCNAAALLKMGVPVAHSLKKKFIPHIKHWVASDAYIKVSYPNQTEAILNELLEAYVPKDSVVFEIENQEFQFKPA
ncbi:glycosyl transferase [Marivirga lumbricoides]|uniref:Glycosyl transferase n=1 Tax=Marivirga lumbricoides TaxID=1046115 RepID=A0ABQ1MDI5_9BACT|nr:glycosyl transferase [Marivirga lumbricoides]